ncbi:hypothetical protein JL09_g6817, partial [Pichia kudriavzevii]
PKLLIIC